MTSRITESIREEILSGELPLGAKISEVTLAARFQTSRTPVREALLALQRDGLVTVKPKSGTYVFMPTMQEIDEICEARAELECVSIRLILRRGKERADAPLRAVLDKARKVIDVDIKASQACDVEFHSTLIHCAGNANIEQAYRLISDKLIALRQLLPSTQHRVTRAHNDHEEVYRCIMSGDEVAASQLIYSHINSVSFMLKAPSRRTVANGG